ncbi:MAG: 30S ribosome-binding factor RbfA [Spirosomataceae bacterium]
MDSKRQQKVARQIQKDLGEIFQRDLQNQFSGAFITITDVWVSPDLSIARVYLSVMFAQSNNWLMEEIKEKTKYIRNLLGQRVRHQMRIVPDLQFFLDTSAEYGAKMDALISSLNIPPLKEGEQIELD